MGWQTGGKSPIRVLSRPKNARGSLSLALRRDGTDDEKVKAVLADGGSVVLPGWAVQRVAAQEIAVPILSTIPYFNRLFKNVGYCRETERVFLMVTPRVIVQEDAAD